MSASKPPNSPQQSAPAESLHIGVSVEGNDKTTVMKNIRGLIASIRIHLVPILRNLAGTTFESAESEEVRTIVSVVNHSAIILGTPLLYEGQEVSLKCTFQKSNGRPMFNLRLLGGSEQKTVYSKKVFPTLALKEKIPAQDNFPKPR